MIRKDIFIAVVVVFALIIILIIWLSSAAKAQSLKLKVTNPDGAIVYNYNQSTNSFTGKIKTIALREAGEPVPLYEKVPADTETEYFEEKVLAQEPAFIAYYRTSYGWLSNSDVQTT